MKIIFTLLFFCSTQFVVCWAQQTTNWVELQQPSLGLTYQLPKNWFVKGHTDSKNCNCTEGTLNTSPEGAINMVIYRSDEYSLDSLERQSIWGYSFKNHSNSYKIETNGLHLQHTMSTWIEDKSLSVIRLSTESKDNRYVIYFWGTLEDLANYKAVIERIIYSLSIAP